MFKIIEDLFSVIVSYIGIYKYILTGRKPLTFGYFYYRDKVLQNFLNDKYLLDCFLNNKRLPSSYGYRLDERLIEYPWVFARLSQGKTILLDAGSALNHKFILESPVLKNKDIVIYSLSPENVFRRPNVSYIYGDLRNTVLRNEIFDEIVCISTLEHIGMDNTHFYTQDFRFKESRPNDYKIVIEEFRRLLKPNRKLFITVPFGRYEDLGWLQQFDYQRVQEIKEVFRPFSSNVSYFKFSKDGWQIVDADACSDCSYFNIHQRKDYEPDYVPAARAIACLELVK